MRLIITPDGGAQSDVWCQIFADLMNLEIKQIADPIYANARGAAWIAAAGLGEIFKLIYKQMKDVHHRLNG